MSTLQSDALRTRAALVNDKVGREAFSFEVRCESLSIAKLAPARVVRTRTIDHVGRARVIAIVVRNVSSKPSNLCIRASTVKDLLEELGSYIYRVPISLWKKTTRRRMRSYKAPSCRAIQASCCAQHQYIEQRSFAGVS